MSEMVRYFIIFVTFAVGMYVLDGGVDFGKLRDNITLYQDMSDQKIVQIMKQVGLVNQTLIGYDSKQWCETCPGGQRAWGCLPWALCLDAEIIVLW